VPLNDKTVTDIVKELFRTAEQIKRARA